MAMSVIHPLTGNALTYFQLNSDLQYKSIWNTSGANELGRLAQGVGDRLKGTDTIFFIEHAQVPKHKTVTYGRFFCDVRPQKAEPEQTILTVRGNLINYNGDVSTQTADLTTSKIPLEQCHINATRRIHVLGPEKLLPGNTHERI
jgi:hypothetical protein